MGKLIEASKEGLPCTARSPYSHARRTLCMWQHRTYRSRSPGAATSNLDRVRPAKVPVVGGCQIFPANNWWNTDISSYPLDPLSSKYIAALPGNLHPDFGENPHYGIPFNIVPSTQKKVPVHFHYSSQSNPGPYPIPAERPDRGWPACERRSPRTRFAARCVQALRNVGCLPDRRRQELAAGSGAIFPLDTNKLRPNGWTSADAAGYRFSRR